MKELMEDLSKILKFTIKSKRFYQRRVCRLDREVWECWAQSWTESIYPCGVSLPLIIAWEQHFKILCRYVRGHSFSDFPVGTEKASSRRTGWPLTLKATLYWLETEVASFAGKKLLLLSILIVFFLKQNLDKILRNLYLCDSII